MVSKKILRIARGEYTDNAAWFMRQAGRYLPDYRKIRAKVSFNNILRDRDLIKKITLAPLNFFPTDGLVIFTDILVPLFNLGYEVTYEKGIEITKRREREFDYYDELKHAIASISTEKQDLTIIGVVGGPFTTFSYVNDGGRTGYPVTKARIVDRDTDELNALVDEILLFARSQIDAGVDVIQVFESWIGSVSENFYSEHLRSMEEEFLENLSSLGVPIIFFAEGATHLYGELCRLPVDVFSLDWRMQLKRFNKYCSGSVVQGNLDPYLLKSSDDYIAKEVREIMKQGKAYRGHIFNLGHGVPPWADPRKLRFITEEVHAYEE